MNVGVFTALFIILVLIVVFFKLSDKEGFQQPILRIPDSPVPQKNLVEASKEDYAPTYILAAGAAPGAIASFNSLPYRDPSLEKAKFERILNLQTTLKGFLENEAKGLEDLSDPSIQLPLSSARGDLSKLRNEVLVLKRNPGIDSSLTQGDVSEINANLAYLQKKWRLSVYNDLDNDLDNIEGFQDSSGADVSGADVSGAGVFGPSGADVSGAVVNGIYMETDTVYNNIVEDITRYRRNNSITSRTDLSYRFLSFVNPLTIDNNKILRNGNIQGGFESYTNAYSVLNAIGIATPNSGSGSGSSGSGSSGSGSSGSGSGSGSSGSGSGSSGNAAGSNSSNNAPPSNNIGISEMRNLINKIDATISRLSSGGTTDPVVVARVTVLQAIKKKVVDILNEVISSARREADIPIRKDDYNEFLKTIADTSSPLQKLFGADSSIAALFPAYSDGDVDGAKFAQNLFDKYSDMLFKGISWDVNVRYTSPAEQTLANSIVDTITQYVKNPNINATANILSAYDINTSNNAFSQVMGTYSNGYNGNVFTDLTSKYLGTNAPVASDPKYLGVPTRSNMTFTNNASPFDWQERATFICDSIKKRGLNPKDFNCLRPDEYVSDDFSWRGYAKMVCTRLGTSMDTGLPEVCGCPPLTWSGWKA